PNPHLVPEAANNLELGLSGQNQLAGGSSLSWGASLFYSRLSDSIESVILEPDTCVSPPCSQLQNVGKSTIRGIEGQLTVNLHQNWDYHLNYTYVDYDHVSQPDLKVRDLPSHSAMSYLRYRPAAPWQFTVSAHYNSDRNSDSIG